jgi:hypothetical protein
MRCTERDDTRGALALHRHAMTQSLEEDRAVVHLARRPVGQRASRKIHVSSFSRPPNVHETRYNLMCWGRDQHDR